MPVPLPILDALETISIASPCTVPWDEMRGDARSRFCGQCRQRVFDLSAMTTAEATELLADPIGRPCVRLYRRPDGRVLTADCPAGLRTRVWRKLRRRAAWAASLFAMLFLPACRTPWQGLVPDAYTEGVDKLPPSLRTGEELSHTTAEKNPQSSAPKTKPGNAFAEFAGNEFNSSSISRIDFPLDRTGTETSPAHQGGEQ